MVILAAGLTPAWQHILTFDRLQPGEVNRAASAQWCASGKVLNVGCALHHLGAASLTLSTFGGETGLAMRAEFESLGVPATWVESRVPTRVCTTLLDQTHGTMTELVENSAAAPADEYDRFAEVFAELASQADWVILSGSLPQRAPAGFYRRLMSTTTARFVLDIRGAELIECLPLRPFLVKPNREELAATLQRPIVTDEQLLAAMQELLSQGAQRLVVSQGAASLWALTPDGLAKYRPPNVASVNPIGCGDCLAAGLTVGFAEGLSDEEAIRFGMAAAADNVQQLLPARLHRQRVQALASEIIRLE